MKNFAHLLNYNVKAELARRKFAHFVNYVMPEYDMQWFHAYLCEKLEAFERGEIKKLMVFMPPQHGKSELTTRKFPAYLLGKNPNRKMVVSSYNATMASQFNRDIQRVIDNDLYNDVFPNTYLNESNVVTVSESFLRNSEIFEIVGHRGFLKACGRGGALTGTPIDVGIIDDPIKDRAEAMSLTIREGLWSWYKDVFETRLHNNSQQLIILTRWHQDDLAGKILKRDNDWDVVVFEGIKETANQFDPREIGDALWPEKHSLERLLKVKETSPLTFNSLYQQSPKPLDDIGIYWNRNIIDTHRCDKLDKYERIVIGVDPATTATTQSDETGIIVGGRDRSGRSYVIADLSGRYSPTQWSEIVSSAYNLYGASCIVAEKNQGGDMVESVIRQTHKHARVKLVSATKGKAVRAEPIFALYEQHKVYHAGEFPILENQMVTFNPESGMSPDRVDALVWMLTELSLNYTQPIKPRMATL
jgi:hypothetical protein